MFSLIVPVRDWPADRLHACVRSYARLPVDLLDEIVVVDFGSDPVVILDGAVPHARVVRLEARRWSLAEAINAGVLASANDVVAKTDADILLSGDSQAGLERAVTSVAHDDFGLLLTQALDLPPTLTLAEAQNAIGRGEHPQARLRPKWGQGGLSVFSRKAWSCIGGFDSRFTGWGNEDIDFSERVRRAGSRVGWIDRNAVRIFHVWHPQTYLRTDVARQRVANNQVMRNDRSVFRTLAFRHSDPTPVIAPQVLRRRHPLVTIGIATSPRPGRDRMLREAIDSFRGQIDNDFETVVLDNGSDDAAHEALKTALGAIRWDAALRIERSPIASIPRARNDVTAAARGRYICVADDDDLALPNRLADHLAPFGKEDLLHGTHGGWIDFEEDSGLIEWNPGKRRTIATMLKGTGKITGHSASFYRADVMRAAPYDESLQLGSDWDLGLRMAALGLEIAHTESYVTLRRFHAANVTLTGQSNQVGAGLRARARSWALFNAQQQEALVAEALANGEERDCRNDFSIGELVELLPDYAGQWRVLVPFATLDVPVGDAVSTGRQTRLEKLLNLTDGDICTMRSGIDQTVMFCSNRISGSKQARALIKAVAALVGQTPSVVSDRQMEIDREQRFDWTSLEVPDGGAIVVSRELSLADAITAIGKLPRQSLLQTVMTVISDHGGVGEAHYLATRPLVSREDARGIRTELELRTGIDFSLSQNRGITRAAFAAAEGPG